MSKDNDATDISRRARLLVRHFKRKYWNTRIPPPPGHLVTSLLDDPRDVEYVLWMWPGVDDDPYTRFRSVAQMALRLKPKSSQVLFFGPKGPNHGYLLGDWIVDGKKGLSDVSAGAVGLFQRFSRSLHIWVAHSYGAAPALYCLRNAPLEMRERTLLITFAGICTLPRGADVAGLEALEMASGLGLHVEAIFSQDDELIPKEVAKLSDAPSFHVPMLDTADVHNRILDNQRALKHGSSAIEHFAESMYSLRERRMWRDLLRPRPNRAMAPA